MKIYLATWLRDYTNGYVMTKVNVRRRLLSWFLYQEEENPEYAFREYVITGIFENRKGRVS